MNSQRLAVVGIGCRFPGNCNTPEQFFENLLSGKDCISEVPSERWNKEYYYDKRSNAGKLCTTRGGFVNNVFEFDHMAFGMSATEASQIDPQQRLLLQTSLEALHDAGIKYRGTNMGVFVGAGAMDYGNVAFMSEGHVNEYSVVGSLLALIPNRVSYCFNLRGPSMVCDTACAASGTALHMACMSIRTGDCDSALVGGVNIVLNPSAIASFSKLGVISPDGKCKSFDAEANGYVRSEGCGVVVIKKLEDAIKDNDRIYCIIRASGTNVDGATSPSLTMPSAVAQKELLQSTLKKAGLQPQDIAYAEAHATGTLVGDPIEANTIGEVFGKEREGDRKLIIGSVKSNVGHLEPAAFIAGFIKSALITYNGKIPPNIHFITPNPKIKFDEYRLQVATKSMSFDGSFISVSSFGIGGANVCVIIEKPPRLQQQADPDENVADKQTTEEKHTEETLESEATADKKCLSWENLYFVSSHSKVLLQKQADHIHQWLQSHKHLPEKVKTLIVNERSLIHKPKYMAVGLTSADNKGDIHQIMPVAQQRPQVCYIFSGQGTQYIDMGRELYAAVPFFKRAIDRCDKLYMQISNNYSLLKDAKLFVETDEQSKDKLEGRLHQTKYALPAIFFMQVALYEMWQKFGLKPDIVMGHSFGELCAMYAAGMLTLDEAIKLVYHRALIMDTMGHNNDAGMIATALSKNAAQELITKLALKNVWISAVNSPSAVTIGGLLNELSAVEKWCKERNIFHRRLNVTNAFHTPLMSSLKEMCLETFGKVLPLDKKLLPNNHVRFVSTVTGNMLENAAVDIRYIWENIEKPVLFQDAIQTTLSKTGKDTLFFEFSCHPALTISAQQTGAENVLHCQHRNDIHNTCISNAFIKLTSLGFDLNWRNVLQVNQAFSKLNAFTVPKYIFEYSKYEYANEAVRRNYNPRSFGVVVGKALCTPKPHFQNLISTSSLAWLSEHKVQGSIILPASAYVEAVLEATGQYRLKNIIFYRALAIPESKRAWLMHTSVKPHNGYFSIECMSDNSEEWIMCATGYSSFSLESPIKDSTIDEYTPSVQASIFPELVVNKKTPAMTYVADENSGFYFPNNIVHTMECVNNMYKESQIYRRFEFVGLEYGPDFRCIKTAIVGDECSITMIDLSHLETIQDVNSNLVVHPIVIDAIFQSFIAAIPTVAYGYLPASMKEFNIRRNETVAIPNKLWAVTTLKQCNTTAYNAPDNDAQSEVVGDVDVYDEYGNLWFRIVDLHCARLIHSIIPMFGMEMFHTVWQAKENQIKEVRNASVVISSEKNVFVSKAATIIKPSNLLELFEESKLCIKTCDIIVFIVHKAYIVINGDEIDPNAHAMCAFVRVLANEYPKKKFRLIDIDDPKNEEKWYSLVSFDPDAFEVEIAVRQNKMYVPRISPLFSANDVMYAPKISFDQNKTYIISGGLGGLGFELALFLLYHEAKHVLLLTRNGELTKRQERELNAWKFANVVIAKINISDSDKVSRMYRNLTNMGLPSAVGGLIHLAGAVDDDTFNNMTIEQFESVLVPKTRGTLNLVELLPSVHSVDFVVLFSSITAVVGNIEQANYAAANAFMDGYAKLKASEGINIRSINLTPVSDAGMIANSAPLRKIMNARGLPAWIDSLGVFRCMQKAICTKGQVEFILNTEFETIYALYEPMRNKLSNIVDVNNFKNTGSAVNDIQQVYGPDSFQDLVKDVAIVLGMEKHVQATELLSNDKINHYGVDSLTAVQLSVHIAKKYGVKIPQLSILNGITVKEIHEFILSAKAACDNK